MFWKKKKKSSVLVNADSPEGHNIIKILCDQYNKAELTKENAQILYKNRHDFANYLLVGIKYFAMKVPDYETVRSILGKDFISPQDVMNSHRGINYSSEQLAYFCRTVPSQEILEMCRDNNFMLIAGSNRPMSFIDIYNINSNYFYLKKVGSWYENEKFSQEDKVGVRWYIIRKNHLPESFSKSWIKQNKSLSKIETVPNAPEFVWAITVYKSVRGIFLFNNIHVRTSSLGNLKNTNISIGLFENNGFHISLDRKSYRFCNLAISVKMKTD